MTNVSITSLYMCYVQSSVVNVLANPSVIPSAASVGFNVTQYNVTEMDLNISVCVIIQSPDVECPVDFSFSIVLLSRDKSAGVILIYSMYLPVSIAVVSFHSEAKYDFKALSEIPVFKRCTKYICVDVTIIDDMDLEGTEQFIIELDVMDERIMVNETAKMMNITILEYTDGRLFC